MESCPVERVIVNGVIVNNPAFRVEAGTQCIVPPCPGKSQFFIANVHMHFQMVCSDWEVSVLCSALLLTKQLTENVWSVMDYVPKVQ